MRETSSLYSMENEEPNSSENSLIIFQNLYENPMLVKKFCQKGFNNALIVSIMLRQKIIKIKLNFS